MDLTESPSQSLASPRNDVDRLLGAIAFATEHGETATALRLVDRAYRMARTNAKIKFLYGKLLLDDKQADRAVELLAEAIAVRADPSFEAAFVAALCADGQVSRAKTRMEAALRSFAVVPGGELAQAARGVVTAIGSGCRGWVGLAPDLRLHGELVGGASGAFVEWRIDPDPAPHHHLVAITENSWAPFHISLARGRAAREIIVSVEGGQLLGGESVGLPADFALDGRVDADDERISGWASVGWMPQRGLDLLLLGANRFRLRIGATPDPMQPGRHVFEVDRALCQDAGDRIAVSVGLPDGSWRPLPGSPLLIEPRAMAAPSLRSRTRMRRLAAGSGGDGIGPTVDVIIPAFRGLEETLACIESVLRTAQGAAEIIVIDDASPEPGLSEALDGLAASKVISLLRNPHNVGFPRSVNRGFALHPSRDVVILNSDVEVFPGWLERLRAAVYAGDRVGTATPLTNSGSIASYPGSGDLDFDRETCAAMDRLIARVNAGTTVELPTGVGFCMYVRRECLAEIGYFDQTTFGKGYGEENDFCLRAVGAGWRNILAADVYVRHAEGRSFGARRGALLDRNIRLLNLRYPGYDARIQTFIAADPAHAARRRVDEERLAIAEGPYVLLVSLALEGGVRRAVEERATALTGQGFTPLRLWPDKSDSDRCILSTGRPGFEDLSYRFTDEIDALGNFLERLKIVHIELHHFLGLPGALIDRLYALGRPVDVTIHDHIWFCPRITLLNGWDVYCGEPDLAGCESCIADNGSPLTEKISVSALRDRSARWLSRARKVFTPSNNAAERISKRFPAIEPVVEPLEPEVEITRRDRRKSERIKVALIGGIGAQKGYNILLAAARDAAARDLPMEFVVLGYTKDDAPLMDTGKVFITGRYQELEIDALIAREQPDVAFFPSLFPETWCYALTHAFRAGLPIAAFDFGAIGERVIKSGSVAILFPLTITAKGLNDHLVQTFCAAPQPRRSGALVVRGQPEAPALRNDNGRTNLIPTASLSRTMMAPNSNGLSATVEILPLVTGLYLFSVKATMSQRIGDDHQLTVPALHVSMGPGTPTSHVDFMFGPRTEGAWLCEPRDTIVVRVKAASTILMLTTVQLPGRPSLQVEVKRLDGAGAMAPNPPAEAPPRNPPAQIAQRPPADAAPVPPPGWSSPRSISLAIVTHVQNRGDLAFSESQWAGAPGQQLAIESFTISPLEAVSPELVEYKAVTATGVETPWVPGGSPCGTRGMGLPLVGFAIRMKPQAGKSFTCEYGARLVSGASLGPARNGSPCRSIDIGDPIEAIWLTISQNEEVVAINPDDGALDPAAARKDTRSRIPSGPRFSAFREPAEPAVD